MSSALSYYAAKNRASARLDNKKNEISRSSAYMIDTGGSYGKTSYTPSYDTLKRESSFTADSGRAGRTRYRDTSVDYSSRPSRRSSSLELSAPVKLRTRDISTDISSSRRDYTNGVSAANSYTSSSRASRPKTTNFEDERSEEYKKIMSNTDKYLTMSKYAKADKETSEVNGMVEEERRSKSYAKIINQQSAASLETDCARETLNDIFMNTSGFSAKSVQAITKEMLYKEEKGPKNYSWRKDMENYEDNLEKTSQHKRNVREATKATRDVGFKDTDSKIRNYDQECRRNVDSDTPKSNSIIINTKPLTQTPSYSSTVERTNNDQSSYRTTSVATNRSESTADSNTEPKRGSWRKDLEKFENQITKKSQDCDTKIETTRNITKSTADSQPKTYSWQKPSSTEIVKPVEVKVVEPVKQVPAWKKTEIVPKPAEFKKSTTSLKKPENADKIVPKVTEPQQPAEPEKSVSKWEKPCTVKSKYEESKPVEIEKNRAEPSEDKPKTLESKEPENQVPKWKKPEIVKEEPKPSEAKTIEPEKSVPKWKKQTIIKKEETKPAEPEKPVPKWKMPAKPKKEEPKPAETKPTEPEKPVPKWKKPEQAIKEEPKPAETKTTEPDKPVPKWKKPVTTKKEEPKPVEPEKPVPKWKKQVTKKEEPKPTEPEKPVPKWKKPDAAKVEETTPAEPAKPVPTWKKPLATKNEEPKEDTESTPTIPNSEPVKETEPDVPTKPESSREEASSTPNPESEAVVKTEDDKKKEEEAEEEEDVTGMRAMRKEQASKFSDMDAEFAAGASKLSALRAKMKALRMKHKASAEADAAADESRKG